MVWGQLAAFAGQQLLSNAMKPKDTSSGTIEEYMKKMRELRPNYELALDDPAYQALNRQGIRTGDMAQQRALNQLISQGFKGSTLNPQIQQQAGITAQQNTEAQKTNMVSQVANRDYQNQLAALKTLMENKLGVSKQQEQYGSGAFALGLNDLQGGLSEWFKKLQSEPGQGASKHLDLYRGGY